MGNFWAFSIRKIVFVISFVFLLFTIAGSYYFYNRLRAQHIKEYHSQAQNLITNVADGISSALAEHRNFVQSLSSMEPVWRICSRESSPSDQLYNLIDTFKAGMGIDVLYLMDKKGKTIASSNRRQPDSFEGKNYSFRPYFRQAMSGSGSVYIAKGSTSQKRGIYVSHPVFTRAGEVPAGVIVSKRSVQALEQKLQDVKDGFLFAVDPQGIIFLSCRPEWVYQSLWKIPPEEMAEILESRKYGGESLQWAGFIKNGDQVYDKDGKTYQIHEAAIANLPGLKLIYLHDVAAVTARVSKTLGRSIGAATVVVCLFINAVVFLMTGKADAEIKKRIEIQRKLAASRASFAAIVHKSFDGLMVVDGRGIIRFINPAAAELFNKSIDDLLGKEFGYPVAAGDAREIDLAGTDGKTLEIHVAATDWGGDQAHVISIRNITRRKLVEDEREKLITELREAYEQVRKLSGLLPICSFCKKIRDDQGYWNRLEKFISDHSEAQFSHSICPECLKKNYPDFG